MNENFDDDFTQGPKISKHQNIFLASSVIIPISPIPDPRSAFGVRKRLGHSSPNSPAFRSREFRFEIPRGSQPGEEMPPTFSSLLPNAKGRGGLSFVEKAEVSYRVTAVWESSDMSENRGMCVIICHAPLKLGCLPPSIPQTGGSYPLSSGYGLWFQDRARIMARDASYSGTVYSVPLRGRLKSMSNVYLYLMNKKS